MAMTVAGMKTAILDAMDTHYGAAEDAADREKFATALANAIVPYIQGNAKATIVASSLSGDPGPPANVLCAIG